ncbi:MAG: hypothetical protein WED05_11565 [Candidatus Atabeyarchaeum deiterrae]
MAEVNQTSEFGLDDALCVLNAYGDSTYELEDTLFHKYIMICASMKKGKGEELGRDKFHLLLDQLSTKGFVKLISRGDKLYWMRLRSLLELEEGIELTPEKAQQMVDEARVKREADAQQRAQVERGEEEPQVSQKPTVGQMADVILSELMKKSEPDKVKSYHIRGESGDVRTPIREMHEALISGEDEFRLYIERSLPPKLKGQLTYFLATSGRDALLAALAVSLSIPVHQAATTKESTSGT